MTPKKSSKKPVVAPAKNEEEVQPEPQTPNRRRWYIALLVAGLAMLATAVFLAISGVLSEQERRLFEIINHASMPGWVAGQIAKPISNAVWGMAFLVAALLIVPKFRLLAWQYAVAAGATYGAGIIVEQLVDRARPIGLAAYEVVARATQDGPGFPSSHVAVLTALGLAVWPFLAWPWRFFLVFLVAAEAWSRIFLGLHAPLDVVGGAAVAMIVVATIHLVPAKIRKLFRLAA